MGRRAGATFEPTMVSNWEGLNLTPGTVIDGKYEIRRVLGAGAMGAVVEAMHLLRRAPVALKFMSPRVVGLPGVVERFLNEGVAASRIDNEHVVKVLDVSKLDNGQPYLVMEYLKGEDLARVIEREGRHGLQDVPRAIYFVLQILRGLQAAHQVGIIHRDLKPANCFVVTNDGDPDFIKIVDFGISKVQESDTAYRLTQDGLTMGTPLYVSLEQARNAANVDARADLYSVAVILYELLCGHTPYQPTSMPDLFVQLATATPKSLDSIRADLPQGLAAVVARGLAREPDARFQSAAEMAAHLAPYADARSELTLRQLLQRPSHGQSRPPSAPPVPGTGPANSAGSVVGVNGGPVTAAGVARTAPQSSGASAETVPAAHRRSSPKRLWVGLGVGAMGIAGVVAFLRWDPGQARVASTEPSALVTPETATPEAATPEAVRPSPEPPPAPSTGEPAPEPSVAVEVPSAQPSAPARPSSPREQDSGRPPSARAQATEATPGTEPKPAAPAPPPKPSLNKIGILD